MDLDLTAVVVDDLRCLENMVKLSVNRQPLKPFRIFSLFNDIKVGCGDEEKLVDRPLSSDCL